MKLSANVSLMYTGQTLEVALANARADGFHAVEILFPYQHAPEQLAQELHNNGLQLTLINTPLGSNGEKGLAGLPGREDEFRQGLQQALRVCADTGCTRVHVMAGCPDTTRHEQARATLLNNLAHALPAAQAAGITLLLEALNRHDVPGYLYWQPQQVLPLLQALNSEHLGLQFDFYHTQKEGLSIPNELNACKGFIRHVQFAAPEGRHEPNLHNPDVRQGLIALRDQGYSGWIGCEYTPAGTVAEGLSWRDHYAALLD